MDIALWLLFIVTFASILVLPGPNAAFAVAQSLKYGLAHSLLVPVGFMTATGIHAMIVFSGLGFIAQKYAAVLVILKWVGVIYLLFLAYKVFTSEASNPVSSQQEMPKSKLFFSAMLVSLTNPKAILTSMMVYPLFIHSEHAYGTQALVLTLSAMTVSFCVYGAYSVAASAFKNGLLRSRRANSLVASLYLSAAGALALKQT